MADSLRLMCIFPHPDDESLGMGTTLAKYAAEGVEIYLLTATRGERGWLGDEREYPGPEALGKIREAELRNAAKVLGIRQVHFLDYIDGDLEQADPAEAEARIVFHLRRIRPQVVVTFGPDGVYGHPDHIALSQLVSAAVVCAADTGYASLPPAQDAPHRVSKLYHKVETKGLIDEYESVFGELVMNVDGIERRAPGWPDWNITTWIDTEDYWQTGWKAIVCHRSQLRGYEALLKLPPEQLKKLWGKSSYYRAYSLVNGGHHTERDLFEGLRTQSSA